MSASNQQQRGGRRQPFGFLNANTLSQSATGKAGSSAISGNGGAGVGAAAATHSSDPVKNESKKKIRGILRSIVTRSKGKRNERSATSTGSGSSADEDVGVPMLESPTKKTRVMMEEDSKPSSSAETTNNTSAAANDAVLPMSGKQVCCKLDGDEFAANDTATIFRQGPATDDADFWNDELEDMLELKQANPILDDGEEEEKGDNVEITDVMMEEDSKPSSADKTNNTLAAANDAVLPMSGKQVCCKLDEDEFAANDTATIFRQGPAMDGADFWNDELEDMLELKQANPILDDGEEEEKGDNVETTDPSQVLTKELDENLSGKPVLWSNRLQEDEDGFKIHFDPRE